MRRPRTELGAVQWREASNLLASLGRRSYAACFGLWCQSVKTDSGITFYYLGK